MILHIYDWHGLRYKAHNTNLPTCDAWGFFFTVDWYLVASWLTFQPALFQVNDEGLWWPAKIVAETEVPPEILKPFLPVHGKIVHLFHSEKNLQPYQVVKRRFVCTKNLQFKSHHACHFDLETTVTGEEEEHCKISGLSAKMIVFWLQPHRNPSDKAPLKNFFVVVSAAFHLSAGYKDNSFASNQRWGRIVVWGICLNQQLYLPI